MAKSTTKNVSAKETFDVEKIKRFTEQELDLLQNLAKQANVSGAVGDTLSGEVLREVL